MSDVLSLRVDKNTASNPILWKEIRRGTPACFGEERADGNKVGHSVKKNIREKEYF